LLPGNSPPRKNWWALLPEGRTAGEIYIRSNRKIIEDGEEAVKSFRSLCQAKGGGKECSGSREGIEEGRLETNVLHLDEKRSALFGGPQPLFKTKTQTRNIALKGWSSFKPPK